MKKNLSLGHMERSELLAEVRKLRQQLKLLDAAQAKLQQTVDALHESGREYKLLLDESSDPIFMVQADGVFRYANTAFAQSVGKRLNKIIGAGIWDMFRGRDANHPTAIVRWVIENGETKTMDTLVSERDGDHYYISTAKPTFNKNNELVSVTCISKDITERKMIEDELRYIISHDSLTKLYNRNFFKTELLRIQRSRQYPISIVVIDIDQLKTTNDRYGQKTGDAILEKMAAVLKKTFRTEEIIARIGGDEFAVLLPETGETELTVILSRLNRDIKKVQDPLLKLTVGWATVNEGNSSADLMQLAEAQLSQNKQNHSQ